MLESFSGSDYLRCGNRSILTGQWSQDELYADAAIEHGAAIARVARGYEMDHEKRRDLNQEIHFQLWRSFALFEIGRAHV